MDSMLGYGDTVVVEVNLAIYHETVLYNTLSRHPSWTVSQCDRDKAPSQKEKIPAPRRRDPPRGYMTTAETKSPTLWLSMASGNDLR